MKKYKDNKHNSKYNNKYNVKNNKGKMFSKTLSLFLLFIFILNIGFPIFASNDKFNNINSAENINVVDNTDVDTDIDLENSPRSVNIEAEHIPNKLIHQPTEKEFQEQQENSYDFANEIVDTSVEYQGIDYLRDEITDTVLPTRYEYGKTDSTTVHESLQSPYNLCWSFAQSKVFETSVAKQKGNNFLELSKRHLDYMASDSVVGSPYVLGRKITEGFIHGYQNHFYQFNGAGLVADRYMPYKEDLTNKLFSQLDNMPKVPYMGEKLRLFDNIVKTKDNLGNLIYLSNSKPNASLTTTEVTNIRNAMKNHIMNKGGVSVGVHVPNSIYQGHLGTPGKPSLYIDPATPVNRNHALVAIGWDDNYSASNFKDPYTGAKPRKNGAWILSDSNSITGQYWPVRTEHRFYVSYEDKIVEMLNPIGMDSIATVNSNQRPKIYQHDRWGGNYQLKGTSLNQTNTFEFANIYKYEGNPGEENVTDVVVEIQQPVTVQIGIIQKIPRGSDFYTVLNQDNTPYLKSVIINEPGIAKISVTDLLDKAQITANRGEHFAVKVKMTARSGNINTIPVIFKRTSFGAQNDIYETLRNEYAAPIKFAKNQSFLKAQTQNGNSLYIDMYSDGRTSGLVIDKVSDEKMIPLRVYTGTSENVIATFQLAGGNINGSTSAINIIVAKGSTPIPPIDPVRQGYVFNGWSPNVNSPISANTTYTAQWKAVTNPTFTAKFNLNGGTINGRSFISNQVVEQGTRVLNPGTPVKEGYNFDRWDPPINTVVMNDITFNAIWSKQAQLTHTVQFNLNGGRLNGSTTVPNQEVLNGEYAIDPGTPTKAGMIFTGWSHSFLTPIRQNTTFVAQWEPKPVEPQNYIVTFNLNGGTGSIPSQTVKEGEKASPVPQPTRPGYTFLRWEPDINNTIINENTVFTARWVINECTYTLKYDPYPKSDVIGKVKYGEKVPTPEIPEFEGYEFMGWEPDITKPLTEHVNIFNAIWRKIHTVTFYNYDGSIHRQFKILNGERITEIIPNPERPGYYFTGWDTLFTDYIYSDMEIYPTWGGNEHLVRFNLNGGHINGNYSISARVVEEGKMPEDPGTPIRTKYIFKGWEPPITEPVTSPVTYQAIWEPESNLNSYTVTFDLNGGILNGNEKISPIEVVEGEYAVEPGVPEKEGQYGKSKFLGWEPDIKKTKITKNTVFKAIWEEASEPITPPETPPITPPDTPTTPPLTPTPIPDEKEFKLTFYKTNEIIFKEVILKEGETFDISSIGEPSLEGKNLLNGI